MAKTDNGEAYKAYYKMMYATGIWPQLNNSILYKVRIFLSWALLFFFFVTMGMQTFHDRKDFTKLSEILYINFTLYGYLIKLAMFAYKKTDVLYLLDFLKKPIFQSYPDEYDYFMVNAVRVSKILARTYQLCIFCWITFYIYYPFLDDKSLPIPFPYDYGYYRYVMFPMQIIGVGWGAWNNSCIDVFTVSLIGIANAQYEILAEKIKNIKNNSHEEINPEVDTSIIKSLKQCVQHYLAIIRLTELIEDAFTVGLLAQFLVSILVICNTIFHIVMVGTINFQLFMLINYLCIITIQLLLYCWYGNNLIVKSSAIGDACYFFKWYNSEKEVRKYLFIMMERSKRPSQITTLKFSTLSFRAFASILQWSYSCLALMLKMYEKRELPN